MSKTTPVRWWRDDATRYQARPPYKAPEPEPRWAFELLTGSVDPELQRCFDRLAELTSPERIYGALGIPAELLDPPAASFGPGILPGIARE